MRSSCLFFLCHGTSNKNREKLNKRKRDVEWYGLIDWYQEEDRQMDRNVQENEDSGSNAV